MKLTVLYFAGLREAIGCGRESLDVPADVTTIQMLRDWLAQRDEAHAVLLSTKNLRVAMAQQMADLDTPLAEGAEVAFFPPVTGG